MHNQYYVYILSSGKGRAIYVGVTSELLSRIYEHKEKKFKGYTRNKGINQLVYYEIFEDIDLAINREKQIKNWKRDWKVGLIEKDNPDWNDLYQALLNEWGV